jgi:hypothetical protein
MKVVRKFEIIALMISLLSLAVSVSLLVQSSAGTALSAVPPTTAGYFSNAAGQPGEDRFLHAPIGFAHEQLALDATGRPHLVWSEMKPDASWAIRYAYWDGATWRGAASSTGPDTIDFLNTPYDDWFPSLAIDSNSRPHVAWSTFDGTYEQVVYRFWDGQTWRGQVDPTYDMISLPLEPNADNAVIAIDGFNRPNIIWSGGLNNEREVFFTHWTGTEWFGYTGITIDNVSNTTGNSVHADLAIGKAGKPYITWQEGAIGQEKEIRVTTWNGSAWSGLAAGQADVLNDGTLKVYDPSITVTSSGAPIVTFVEDSRIQPDPNYNSSAVYIRRWNGSAWTGFKGPVRDKVSDVNGSNFGTSVVIDINNQPHVAWGFIPPGQQYEIHYRRWNGSAWVGLTGSQSSNVSGQEASLPDLVVDAQNRIHFSWMDYDVHTYDPTLVYTRWNP